MQLQKLCKNLYHSLEKAMDKKTENLWLNDNKNRVLNIAQSTYLEVKNLKVCADKLFTLDLSREIVKQSNGNINEESITISKRFDLTFAQFDMLKISFCIALLENLLGAVVKKDDENISSSIKSLILLENIDFDVLRLKCLKQEQELSKTQDYTISDENTIAFMRQKIGVLSKKSGISESAITQKICSAPQGALEILFGQEQEYLLVQIGLKKTSVKRRQVCFLSAIFALTILATVFVWLKIGASFAVVSIVPFLMLFYQIVSEVFIKRTCLREEIKLKPALADKAENKTSVTLTVMITDENAAQKSINTIEEYFCGNRLQNACYLLLADLKVASNIEDADDKKVLDVLCEGIKELNKKYSEQFCLIVRSRIKNNDGYYAYERKRGALKQLCEYILEDKGNFKAVENIQALKDVKYVATFDADTLVPPGTVETLISAIAHPFNKPMLKEGIVLKGSALVAPNVKNTLYGGTLFSDIYSFGGGMDSYSNRAIELYNDTFFSGTYCGKGIFDVQCFFEISKRIKDNTVLSHDIIEGELLKATVSSSQVFDEFPKNPISFYKRQERWMRGDWLLLPWLFKDIKLISKQKIFFNIVKTILPTFIFVQMLFAPAFNLKAFAVYAIVLFELFISVVLTVVNGIKAENEKFVRVDNAYARRITFYKALLSFVFLPFEAYLGLKCAIKALYRRFISHKNVLQWSTFSQKGGSKKDYYKFLFPLNVFAVILLAVSVYFGIGIFINLAVACVWSLGAGLAYKIGQREDKKSERLFEDEQEALYLLAMRIVRFFYDSLEKNDIMPDNLQIEPYKGYAMRTSPTNIGFALLYPLCAYHLSAFSANDVLDKILKQMDTLLSLKRYKGHLYNWYDLKTKKPLSEYVSTVDSGNYFSALTMLCGISNDILEEKPLSQKRVRGIALAILSVVDEASDDYKVFLQELATEIIQSKNPYLKIKQVLDEDFVCTEPWKKFVLAVLKSHKEEFEALSFAEILQKKTFERDDLCALKELLQEYPKRPNAILSDNFEKRLNEALWGICDRQAIALKEEILKKYYRINVFAYSLKEKCERLNAIAQKEIDNADFSFLYNEKKNLLYIGYDAKTKKASAHHYDMLCSEARLTSFLLIAHNKIPPKNWFVLSRPFTRAFNRPMCLSWSGTMFEYLMPDIFIKGSEKSMLFLSNDLAVKTQIERGKNGVWGISESAYKKLDVSKEYKYKAFGVSACAVGRAAEENVFSPYSTLLALEYAPKKVMDAVKVFVEAGMAEAYGLFEALDITNSRATCVKTFMAHHSGMSLCALTNFLFSGCLRKNFAKNPSVNSAYVLLEEKMPSGILPRTLLPVEQIEKPQLNIRTEYEDFYKRECLLLENGEISAFVFNDGKIEIKKNENLLLNEMGLFVNDIDCYSATLCSKKENIKRKTVFVPGQAEFYSNNKTESVRTNIFVCDDSDTVMVDTLIENKTDTTIKKELMLVCAPILCREADNKAHPKFNGLFIEAEEQENLLLMHNKKTNLWCAVFCDGARFSSDRERVYSSGDIFKPDFDIDRVSKYPINPIIAAKKEMILEPEEKKNLTFVFSFANDKETVIKEVKRFTLRAAVALAGEQAQTRARAKQKGDFVIENKLCALLAEFNRADYSLSVEASEIWRFGISDERPLVFITVEKELAVLKQVLNTLNMLYCAGVNMEVLIAQETLDDYFCGDFNKIDAIISSFSIAERVHHIKLNQIKSIEEIKNLASVYIDVEKELNIECAKKVRGKYLIEGQGKKNVILSGEFDNGYGKFLTAENAYYIYRQPPTTWSNILTNEHFGCLTTSDGGGYSWAQNSRQKKLTPWYNDSVLNPLGEAIILKDKTTDKVRSITKKPFGSEEACDTIFYRGTSVFRSVSVFGEETQTVFVHPKLNVKITKIETETQGELYYFARAIFGERENRSICVKEKFGAAVCQRQNEYFFIYAKGATCFFEKDSIDFSPSLAENKIKNEPNANTLCLKLEFNKEANVFLGYAQDEEELKTLITTLENVDVDEWLAQTKEYWQKKCDKVKIKTPSKELNTIFSFLNYQTIASRMFARCGFYQAGGAFGFRDQLQDCLSLILTEPKLVREHILKCSTHQFAEGDVQHWWHEPYQGVRTRISDDLLFLPYVASKYALATGDEQIFDEVTPYLEGHSLQDRDDVYESAWQSKKSGTLREHCLKAIKLVILRSGENGLPLMLAGDWNDGMDCIGKNGKGESVWLGWFLYSTISLFAPFLEKTEVKEAQELKQKAVELARVLNEKCFSGEWFYRAFDDKGRKIGSDREPCCKIDLISQAWSVLSGAGENEKCLRALQSVEKMLVDREKGIVKLLAPPFDKKYGAGYIGDYVPGVRENGGQYTHAAIWLACAFAQIGQGEKCFEIIDMINPIKKSDTVYKCQKYKVEPYVIPADVYLSGRGGWTWYTASSSLYFCAILEELLGVRQENGQITVNPHIPEIWQEFEVKIDTDEIKCEIKVLNPKMHTNSVSTVTKTKKDGVEEIRVIM